MKRIFNTIMITNSLQPKKYIYMITNTRKTNTGDQILNILKTNKQTNIEE